MRDLLERSLEVIRASLRSNVECGCELARDGAGEIGPVPETCDPDMLDQCERELALVRDIEAAIGAFADHDDPQWLDDLVAGRWSLS